MSEHKFGRLKDDVALAFKTCVEQAETIERLHAALATIADIGEGSTTANSLPNIARIAREALKSS